MIPRLRRNILNVDVYDDVVDAKSLIFNIQNLFSWLQETRGTSVSPLGFTNIWTNEDGEKINVAKQEVDCSCLYGKRKANLV
jgi:hypothetical protein